MNRDIIHKELQFKAVRSSGAGGQHVNKVSSKVELFFDVSNSKGLSVEEKELLQKNLSSKLTKGGVLQLNSSESRSQHRNKELVIQRFFEVVSSGLIKPKRRKKTKPSKASVQKRLQNKHNQSSKKSLRKKPNIE